MNHAIEALNAWKNQAIPRGQFLRRLLEDENWNMPMNEGVDSFGPFTLALPKLVPDAAGHSRVLLFADYDAQEVFERAQEATGRAGFANPTGWEIFSVPLKGVDAVVFDPGAPHEFTIPAAEFAEVRELAEAVAVEQAWKRLREGDEEEGDSARVARHAGYHLAVVQREEGVLLMHVPNDDDERKFAPLFTHADALALALDEFRESFAPAEIKTLKLNGAQAFPVLAKETADGVVINFRGPGEPMAFQMGVVDLMLEELAKTPSTTSQAADET